MEVVSQKPSPSAQKSLLLLKQLKTSSNSSGANTASNLIAKEKILQCVKSFCNGPEQNVCGENGSEGVETETKTLARAKNVIHNATVVVKPSGNIATATAVESVTSDTPVIHKIPFFFTKWEFVEFDLTRARELAAEKNGKNFMHVIKLFTLSFHRKDNFARIPTRATGN